MSNQEYLEKLKEDLSKKQYSKSYSDLCIQYSQRLLENNLPVIFDFEHLSLLIGVKKTYLGVTMAVSKEFYRKIRIPKKSGGYRELSVPAEGLKYIQRWILDNILYNIRISQNAKGFLPNHSILDNAKQHSNQECLINIDIQDFFPTIKFDQVFRIFNYYGYTNEMSYILTKLCTYNNCLPQGAPTSPYISNIVCLKLDKRLSNLCKTIGANYSRYADDISISGNKYIDKYLSLIEQIVNDEGFRVNNNKTRILYKNNRQEVTGLIVNNNEVKVPRELKRYIRKEIYYCKKYGVTSHLKKTESYRSNYRDYLYGLAYYVSMVEPMVGKRFVIDLDKIHWGY